MSIKQYSRSLPIMGIFTLMVPVNTYAQLSFQKDDIYIVSPALENGIFRGNSIVTESHAHIISSCDSASLLIISDDRELFNNSYSYVLSEGQLMRLFGEFQKESFGQINNHRNIPVILLTHDKDSVLYYGHPMSFIRGSFSLQAAILNSNSGPVSQIGQHVEDIINSLEGADINYEALQRVIILHPDAIIVTNLKLRDYPKPSRDYRVVLFEVTDGVITTVKLLDDLNIPHIKGFY